MSQLSFDHLLNLSFSFHTHRKTGEVLRILDRGAAINHTLELILFNIIPTFVDIFVALIFFCVYFEWTLALVIFLVMTAYSKCSMYVPGISYLYSSSVAASIILTRWRTQLRRQMNERDVVRQLTRHQCVFSDTNSHLGYSWYSHRLFAQLRDRQVLRRGAA